MIELDETAAGQSVTAHLGDQVRVCLAENPTTGYRWLLARNSSAILTLMHDQATAPGTPDTPPRPGEPGQHVWVFKAHSAGEAELRFESTRPWEKTATGKTLVFPIAVKAQ